LYKVTKKAGRDIIGGITHYPRVYAWADLTIEKSAGLLPVFKDTKKPDPTGTDLRRMLRIISLMKSSLVIERLSG
jgi:hypothetical protein